MVAIILKYGSTNLIILILNHYAYSGLSDTTRIVTQNFMGLMRM